MDSGVSSEGARSDNGGRVRRFVTSATHRARGRFEAVRERSPVVGFAASAGERFVDINGSILAGLLAYRLFLLVLPLAVVLVALSGYYPDATEDAGSHLKLGQSLTTTIATAGQEAGTGRPVLLVTGLAAFLLAAWGMLSALQLVSAQAWGIPIRRFPGKGRSFVRLAVSLLLFGVVVYLAAVIRRAGVVAGLAGSLASLLSMFVAYGGLGWLLPRRSREWFWLLPGAVVGAVGQLGLVVAATFVVSERLSTASEVYGALGLTVTLLGYLFLLGLLLVLAPVVNAAVWERFDGEAPGLLRRIAERVPIPTTTWGSGYVPEGGAVDR